MLTSDGIILSPPENSLLLKPNTLLVLGPGGPANRTTRTLAALRRHRSESETAHVDTSLGLERALDRLTDLKAEGSFDCVLCYDVHPEFIGSLLEHLSQLGVTLIALGSGGTDGVQNLVEQASKRGMRLIGPNAYGPFIADSQLFVNPLPPLRSTGLAVLTQSGNIALDAVAEVRHLAGSGPAVAWGTGNGAADLGLAEAVAMATDDPGVKAIAVHGEGFSQGRTLLRAVAAAARRKPVVFLHGGTSDAGRASALSHTGNLSTSKAVTCGAFTQAGAEVLKRSDEFVPIGLAMSLLAGASAKRVAVIADGGGQATLMVDALDARGIGTQDLAPDTIGGLRTILGDDAHIANPLDVGNSPVEQPTVAIDAARAVLDSADVDCVLVVGVIGAYALHFDAPELAEAEELATQDLARHAAKLGKAVIFVSSYAEDMPAAYQRLWENGVPVVGSIDVAAGIVQALRNRTAFLAQASERTDFPPATPSDAEDGSIPTVLDESASRSILERCGLKTGALTVTGSADEASTIVDDDQKYVIKVVSPDISHKSDVGGVRLNVNAENIRHEFACLMEAVKSNAPKAVIEGVSVAPMATPGVEILVGAYRDPAFGPCVAVGSGGVLAELLRDAVIRVAPVTRVEAEEMIQSTMSARLLEGYRGSLPADKAGLAELIVSLGAILAGRPEIQEIDLNPVIVSASSPQVADARVVVRGPGTRPTPGQQPSLKQIVDTEIVDTVIRHSGR